MSNNTSDKLTSKIQQHLDDAVSGMDGQLQSRLRQARATAIDNVAGKQATLAPRYWLPAGIVMAAVLMLTVLILPLQPNGMTNGQSAAPAVFAIEDIDILTDPEDLELYEDLEFYRWMSVHEMG